MPAAEIEEAVRLACEADVFLAIGSSLVVEPAASLPRMARRAGARLVILNRTETPLDDLAELVIRAPIGQSLSALLQHCGTSEMSRSMTSPAVKHRATGSTRDSQLR